MTHKISPIEWFAGLGASLLVSQVLLKILFTTLAMLIGHTAVFFWRRWLEKKFKSKSDQDE